MAAPETTGDTTRDVRKRLADSAVPVRAPDLAELETLIACAAEGSLLSAAERLGVSRPSVAKRLKNLEVIVGRPLLERDSKGVRLTEAGALLIAGARRMLDERDLLMSLVSEIRGEQQSAIAGLRALIGHTSASERAAQRPEARLAETERMLERVLRASSTGVALSSPDTAIIHEVNDAFCRFVGRSRAELIGKSAIETTWFDPAERPAIIEQIRRTGSIERMPVRVRRPDGTMRAGETSAALISVAGAPQILATIDDITVERRIGLEQAGTLTAYRALATVAANRLAGRSVDECVVEALPALRRCGEFSSALLWDIAGGSPISVVGDEPWPDLEEALAAARPGPAGEVQLLDPSFPHGGEIGFAVALPGAGRIIVLLSARAFPPSAQALTCTMLDDLASVIGAEPRRS